MKSEYRALLSALRIAILLCASMFVAGARAQPATEPAAASAAVQRPAEWATPIDPARNLYQITPQLYRSAQPEQADAPRLQALGIRTIINFRAFHRDEDAIDMPGVKLVHIPMKTWRIGSKHIVAALRAIEAAKKDGPVLIHCQHGADRTGVVSAMYRIVEQGWTREQASRELRKGDFGFHGIWVNIPRYLEKVDIEAVRAAIREGRSA
ncbi:MAG: dual specificity protein phosphatase family protein [Betaproteobacteria bacterium]|nr:dual specificity protein phosphatase family protein [Betaproteobacteria bacterium]